MAAKCSRCRTDAGWFQRVFVLGSGRPLYFDLCAACLRQREQRRGGPYHGGRPAPSGVGR